MLTADATMPRVPLSLRVEMYEKEFPWGPYVSEWSQLLSGVEMLVTGLADDTRADYDPDTIKQFASDLREVYGYVSQISNLTDAQSAGYVALD